MKPNGKLAFSTVSLNICSKERDKEEWNIINPFRPTMFLALNMSFIVRNLYDIFRKEKIIKFHEMLHVMDLIVVMKTVS